MTSSDLLTSRTCVRMVELHPDVPKDLRRRLEQARLESIALFRTMDRAMVYLSEDEFSPELRAVFELEADCAEALWGLDQPLGGSRVSKMLKDAVANRDRVRSDPITTRVAGARGPVVVQWIVGALGVAIVFLGIHHSKGPAPTGPTRASASGQQPSSAGTPGRQRLVQGELVELEHPAPERGLVAEDLDAVEGPDRRLAGPPVHLGEVLDDTMGLDHRVGVGTLVSHHGQLCAQV